MGIFDGQTKVFTTYAVTIQMRNKLMGGIPRDPKVIEGWLRAKAGMEQQEEIRQATLRTLIELGAEVNEGMTYEEAVAASEKLAAGRSTNGFKRDDTGLYLESRAVKAMLREAVNILFAGERWGATKKGPRGFIAERAFPKEDHIPLLRDEADGVELFIGHVSGPTGKNSTLTYHEYVEGALLSFHILSAQDDVMNKHWPEIWVLAQENGLGALRSQGFGRFDVTKFEKVA